MKYKVIRNITNKECHWVDKDIKKGTIVYKFIGCTYGCCGDGIPITFEKDGPFIEVPSDALKEIK